MSLCLDALAFPASSISASGCNSASGYFDRTWPSKFSFDLVHVLLGYHSLAVCLVRYARYTFEF